MIALGDSAVNALCFAELGVRRVFALFVEITLDSLKRKVRIFVNFN